MDMKKWLKKHQISYEDVSKEQETENYIIIEIFNNYLDEDELRDLIRCDNFKYLEPEKQGASFLIIFSKDR